MFNNKRVRGTSWAYAAFVVLLAARCVSSVAEERLNELMGELLERESGDSVDVDSPLSSNGGGSRP